MNESNKSQGDDQNEFTHLSAHGEAHMVNISDKHSTHRTATARGFISMSPETLEKIKEDRIEKGDVLQVARIASIMAGKKTSELIPLCHAIQVTSFTVNFIVNDDLPGIVVETEAISVGKTGAEMEALTGVSVALLTIYDMAKSLDKAMVISQVQLLSKKGGKSGDWSVE